MNIVSLVVGAVRMGMQVADMAGYCKGCHIRKPDVPHVCDSCEARLCSVCVEDMHRVSRDINAQLRKVDGPAAFQSDILLCAACGKPWGNI